MKSEARALSVSELTHQAKRLLEASFMQVWVEGELSSLSRPSSGHWYFSLKDAKCQVRCAMFRSANQRLKSIPKEGDQIRLRGRVTLYENRGDFQIVVEHIETAGEGALLQAFEALKTKLKAEGLFDPARKRSLPDLPGRIGIVTSPTGAAIHDLLTVLNRRCPGIPITLYPTAVQGKTAAQSLVAAIELANRHGKADVLIVGRGGGSLEDLWCFNEEAVARAIAASQIPTVSAVGHEVDVTIADLVADLRAPTPSAAAETVAPDQSTWLRRLDGFIQRFLTVSQRLVRQRQQHLKQLAARLRDPRRELQDKAQRLDELEQRLGYVINQCARNLRSRMENLYQRLQVQSPETRLKSETDRLNTLELQLCRAMGREAQRRQQSLNELSQTLHIVSPLATLGRGYAIVQRASDEAIIRQGGAVKVGDSIRARLSEGAITATVTKVTNSQ